MARGGGGSGRGPMPREVQVSKKISWLLRHGAEKEGLQLGPGGYANASEVLNNRNLRSLKVTFDELRAIVVDNDKQRFSLIPVSGAPSASEIPSDDAPTTTTAPDAGSETNASTDPKDYLIRANQGHSLKVENEGLLTPIDDTNIPETVVHGTSHGAWPLIVSSGGLNRMGRTHVHFASGLPAGFKSVTEESAKVPTEDDEHGETTSSAPVISGMRNSSSILVFLDLPKAIAGGVKFWLSENGVVLSEGDKNGRIDIKYFKRVEDRTGGQGVLVEHGQVIKEAPQVWASKGTGRRGGRGGGRGGRGGRSG